MATTADELLDTARDALAAGDFETAQAAALASLEIDGLAVTHQIVGGLYYMDDRATDALRHWEAAFRLFREAGELRSAARVAIDLARLHVGMLGHVAAGQGWAERARTMLGRVGPCVEWGYLELAYMACDRPDIDALLASTDRALTIALEFGDSDLEVQAMADSGLALVSQGRVSEGFARLDAALAAISAGEVGPVAAGISFCSMLTACDRVGDVRRAEEWTGIIEAVLSNAGNRPAGVAHSLPRRLRLGALRGRSVVAGRGADDGGARTGRPSERRPSGADRRSPRQLAHRAGTRRGSGRSAGPVRGSASPVVVRSPGSTCCAATSTSPRPSCGAGARR